MLQVPLVQLVLAVVQQAQQVLRVQLDQLALQELTESLVLMELLVLQDLQVQLQP